MLTFHGREIPETLAEVVDPRHTTVIVHDMQKDNTGAGGVYDKAGRRINVSHILPLWCSFWTGHVITVYA